MNGRLQGLLLPRVRGFLAICVLALGAGWMVLASGGAAMAAPVTLPAQIEAEDFNDGDPGVAFSDTDASVGGYRTDVIVDAFQIDGVGASGAALLGRTRDGEFTTYTMDVDASQEFEVRLRVASGHVAPGVIHVDIDNERVGTVDGNTERWFDWTSRSAGTVTLEPGEHTLKLTWDDGANVNLDRIDIVATAPAPATCAEDYQSTADATLNGRFDYVASEWGDDGGPVAVPRGSGGRWYAPSDDYVEFCASVAEAGDYVLYARVMGLSNSKRSFKVAVDDGPIVDFVSPTPTMTYALTPVNDAPAADPVRPGDRAEPTIEAVKFTLEPGDHSIKFYVRRDGSRLSGMMFSPASEPPPVLDAGCWNCGAVRTFLEDAGISVPASVCGMRGVTCTATQAYAIFLPFDGPTPASVGGLTGVNYLSVSNTAGLPREIGYLTALRELTIRNTGTAPLPPELGDLPFLERVRIRETAASLPAGIDNFANLKQLEVINQPLTSVSPGLFNLTSLEELSIIGASIAELPPEIGNLTNLKELNLGSNRLTSLPPEIGNLANLESLSLFQNLLASLPPEIGNLTNLETLDLATAAGHSGDVRFESLPPEIVNLENLRELDLGQNHLSELPANFDRLTNLEKLWIQTNSFTSLPPAILELENLTSLRLNQNDWTPTPSELAALASLQNLTRLDISTGPSRLDDREPLAPEIGDLVNLESLYLQGYSSVPSEIRNLQNLTELRFLAGLEALPPEIGDLVNLETLSVTSRELAALPPEIGNLANLRNASFWGNRIRTLPPEFSRLNNLETLDLRTNRLRGDITILASVMAAGETPLLSDNYPQFVGGNDCLTTTDAALAARLDEADPGWDVCVNP